MLHVFTGALTLIHMSLLWRFTLRSSSSWCTLVLRCNIRQAPFICIWDLSRLGRSHDISILSILSAVIIQASNTAWSCIQHIVLSFALAADPNYFGGCIHASASRESTHTMSAHSSLSWLSSCFIKVILRISCSVCSAWLIVSPACWLSHLTFRFVSIGCCNLFQALYLACHVVT